MKYLTLIRHAKSSHDNRAMPDLHRPLDARGRRDASAMGRHLDVSLRFSPDVMMASTAARAIATARVIAQETGYDEWGIKQEERIYEAPVGSLLEVVRELPETAGHAALVGHNPGFENFCNWLCGQRVIDGLKTTGVLLLSLDIAEWKKADAGRGELLQYLYPALIGPPGQAPPA